MQRPQVPAFQPSPEFLARQKRMEDAFNLRRPDRVPVAPVVIHYYAARAAGMSHRDAQYDTERNLRALQEATLKNDWDAAVPGGSVFAGRPLELDQLAVQSAKEATLRARDTGLVHLGS